MDLSMIKMDIAKQNFSLLYFAMPKCTAPRAYWSQLRGLLQRPISRKMTIAFFAQAE